MYCFQIVCLYMSLENTMDLLNFCDCFSKSLDDGYNEKSFALTTSSISLPVNCYFPPNLFVSQYINWNIDLDTDSIKNFNAI